MRRQVQKDDAPQPFMKGRFALYQKPDGGIHLTFREDDGEVQHEDIPALYVNFLKNKARGLMGIIRGMG